MKLSIVLPTFTIDNHLEELAIKAIHSYRYYADEIIITEDGGRFSPQLMALSDVYLYNKVNRSFTANVNRGWKLSTGDFTAIVNSDTYLYEGNLLDLCIEGKVTSPVIINQNIDLLAGCFFVVPKEIASERGYLIEDMKTYSSDSEYEARVKDIFQTIPSVKIFHSQAQTVKAAGVEGQKQQDIDREVYAAYKRNNA